MAMAMSFLWPSGGELGGRSSGFTALTRRWGRHRRLVAPSAGSGWDNASVLQGFSFHSTCKQGRLEVRLLQPHQVGQTMQILADSFADLLFGPLTYRPLLDLIVRENLVESQRLFPNNAVLIASYFEQIPSEEQDEADREGIVAGTVEVYLSTGPSSNIAKPSPPQGSSYLCNMAVRKELRRRGIGRELLRAAEQLAVEVGRDEMYLHCRLADCVPLGMYTRAGYEISSTSSLLTSLLFLQRRRHLMSKSLATVKV